jgi:hypothetical protein
MTYRYFKYLDLDWQPASQKLAMFSHFLTERSKTQKSPWMDIDTKAVLEKVPELTKMVEPLKATIRFVAFFVSTGNGVIHIDDDPYSKCRINIPVQNCDDTETQFFKNNLAPTSTTLSNNVKFYKIDEKGCTYADHFNLTQAVLFRNTEPHKVVCNHNRIRISCTIGLHENLEYLLQ